MPLFQTSEMSNLVIKLKTIMGGAFCGIVFF
jgi:hypothetical protein